MGWGSGSQVMGELIDSLKRHVPDDEAREAVYVDMINALQDMDCDTLQECEGEDEAFDNALREANPDWYEDEEDD
jgi:hypothetical protein